MNVFTLAGPAGRLEPALERKEYWKDIFLSSFFCSFASFASGPIYYIGPPILLIPSDSPLGLCGHSCGYFGPYARAKNWVDQGGWLLHNGIMVIVGYRAQMAHKILYSCSLGFLVSLVHLEVLLLSFGHCRPARCVILGCTRLYLDETTLRVDLTRRVERWDPHTSQDFAISASFGNF